MPVKATSTIRTAVTSPAHWCSRNTASRAPRLKSGVALRQRRAGIHHIQTPSTTWMMSTSDATDTACRTQGRAAPSTSSQRCSAVTTPFTVLCGL